MRKNVGADYYGFNRDKDDGTKGVERAEEEGAPEGWPRIPDEWVVPGFDEVTEFFVEEKELAIAEA